MAFAGLDSMVEAGVETTGEEGVAGGVESDEGVAQQDCARPPRRPPRGGVLGPATDGVSVTGLELVGFLREAAGLAILGASGVAQRDWARPPSVGVVAS